MKKSLSFIHLILISCLFLYAPLDCIGALDADPLPRVVIAPFSAVHPDDDRNQSLAGAISDLLMIELSHSNQMVLVDRSLIDHVFHELGLLAGGIGRGDGNAVLIGRITKADLAVSGLVIEKGGDPFVIVRVFNPVSGILLDVSTFAIPGGDFQSTAANISRFVHAVRSKMGNNKKKRFFAFRALGTMNQSPSSLNLCQEIMADMEKRYSGAPHVGVVVRSGIDSLLVEHYLASVSNIERESVLTDAKSASAIIDLRLEKNRPDNKSTVQVRINLIGFGRHTLSQDFEAIEYSETQLGSWMDKKLQVYNKSIPHEKRKLAYKIYNQAMEMGKFSYKRKSGRMTLCDGSGAIRNWGYMVRDMVGKERKTKLPQIMDAFEQVLTIDPAFHRAMLPLAYCYLWKTEHNAKRGRELLRRVYHESSDDNLKRDAQTIIWGSRITVSELKDFSGDGETLFNALIKNKYIEERGHRLYYFDTLPNAAKLKVPAAFTEYKDEIFWLLKETQDGYSLNKPHLGTSAKEAVSHYEQGLQKSGFSFKAYGRIRKKYGMGLQKYLSNFDVSNPEIIMDKHVKTMTASRRKKHLQEAINAFASALYIDPLFHEAMLMLSQCLRDPLIGQAERADRLCKVVLSESAYEYFRKLAKASLLRHKESTAEHPKSAEAKKSKDRKRSGRNKTNTLEGPKATQPSNMVQFAPIEEVREMQTGVPDSNIESTGVVESGPITIAHPTGQAATAYKMARISIEDTHLERHTPTGDGGKLLKKIRAQKTILHRNRMFLGTSVAMSDDVAVIAAPWANHGDKYYGGAKYGALFLFKRNGQRWSYENKLISGRASLQFGRAVDISGSRIIAGAPIDSYKGPVRLKDFHNIRFDSSINTARLLDKLFQQGYLDTQKMVTDKFTGELSEAFKSDFSECTDEDLNKIIKILKASQARTKSGAAYIYENSPRGWQRTAILAASDACDKNNFGRYVAIFDDHAVIGSSSGAYFFHFSEGRWVQTIKRSECKGGRRAVTGLDSMSLQGAKPVDIIGPYAICASYGAAFIFHWDGSQWTRQATLAEGIDANQNSEYFGTAVAMGAGFAVVSNSIHQHAVKDSKEPSTGIVYVFKKDGSTWPLWATLTGEQNGQVRSFGSSVAVSGPYILVSAPRYNKSGYNEASVYIYEVQDERVLHHGRMSIATNNASDTKSRKKSKGFGCALAMHGQRIVVGADRASNVVEKGSSTYEGGAAYLFDW